jgi:hypothetical protein
MGLPIRPQRVSHNSGAPRGRALPLLASSIFSFDRVAPAALSFFGKTALLDARSLAQFAVHIC